MKRSNEFPFEKARRITASEVESAAKAIADKLGKPRRPRRGRPPKPEPEKTAPVSIRLSPRVLRWAKHEAKKRGTGYQTFIKQVLQRMAQ